ncbi:NIPSNAP family protein [Salegentibacter sp. F188]|uniref:NIPSNAP family protein n=1 Tax=Autumnicola patrickiae TaxID=3075591 RepID=A0ABU3DXE6_9FLAO|nr:NIPSNAP family protein [Salegentibacter sp. F188]MDT0688396.1 NIPSNAP family protein [Salegentibacter sp. F188]
MFKPTLAFLFLLLLTTFSNAQEQNQDQEFYQLKIYHFEDEAQVERTDDYLKNAYLPALKETGIQNTGVFKPHENGKNDSIKKTYVLIPFQSLEQWESINEELGKNENFLKKAEDFINSDYKDTPYLRFESTLLKAFEDMPQMEASALEGPREDRVYELRSYESPTETLFQNKVDMFNDGEVEIFDELGFNAVFYAEVISGPDMPNLMYMTTFPDKESRDEHWKQFGEAPAWKKLSSKPEYPPYNVSHADILFLYPTEYSDY